MFDTAEPDGVGLDELCAAAEMWPGFDDEAPEPPAWLSEDCADSQLPTSCDVLFDPNGAAEWASTFAPGPIVAQVIALIDVDRLNPKGRTDLLLAATR
jgi:hypothetical protein